MIRHKKLLFRCWIHWHSIDRKSDLTKAAEWMLAFALKLLQLFLVLLSTNQVSFHKQSGRFIYLYSQLKSE